MVKYPIMIFGVFLFMSILFMYLMLSGNWSNFIFQLKDKNLFNEDFQEHLLTNGNTPIIQTDKEMSFIFLSDLNDSDREKIEYDEVNSDKF